MSRQTPNACLPEADNKLGPAVKCPHTFDFTLLFEQSILSIGPSVIFLLLSSGRAWHLRKSNFKIPQTALGYAKLITTFAYLGISIALLALWSHNSIVRTAIPSAALSLINAFAIIGLSFNEHRRSIRPSSLLCIFIICSISFDVVQARTIFIRGFRREIGGLLVVGIVLKIFILLLESFGKRALLHERYRLSSPEALAGIISRTVFWWLKGLFIDGTRKLLCLQDLSSLDDSLASATLESRMEKAWGKYTQRRYRIVFATISCFLWPLLRIILLRLCLIGLNYAQPFLISRAINLLIQPINETTSNDGKGLIGATALIYVGLAVFTVHYNHHVYRLITGFRGAMVSLIFSKTLDLSADAYDQSSAVTLMSTDVDRISGSLQLANEVWARCVEIIVGIWLLERQLGAVCVAPIIIVLLCTAGEMKIAKFIGGSQKKWVEAIQQRIGMTSTILGSMRSTRMTGLSDHIEDIIQRQRIRELELGKEFRWLIVWLNVIASIPQFSAPLITFGAFVIKTNVTGSKQLSISEAFTSLATIYLITSPAAVLLGSLPVVSSAMGCFDRIQAFLESAGHSSPPSPVNNIHSETRSSSEIEMNLSPSGNPKNFTKNFGVMLKDASVPASINSPAVLHSISAEFTCGSVTAIIGPVGSGKSTLLKAILREMPCEKGSIKNDFGTIGYCSQLPWLPNDTIQRAICGPSPYDETWYTAVVKACLLDEDFKIIDGQDQNKVGSQGRALSGGQKQRISIARAVYARTPLMLFDDIFSALDIDTETKMTIRLFGDAGLVRQLNTTVIVTTNSAHFLPFCHQIIVLNAHGKIENSGSLEKLSTQHDLVKDLIETPVQVIENKLSEKQQQKPPTNKLAKGPTADQFADLTRQTGDTAVYSYYLKSIGIWYSILAIGIIAAHLFAVNFPQIWLKWYTNGAVKGSGTFISVYTVLVVLAICGHGAMIWQIMLKIVPKSGARLHAILLRTAMRCQMYFFISIDIGVILNRFSQDMTLVDAVLPSEAFGTLKEAMQCIASAALISQGSSYMALLIIPSIVLVYFIQKFYLQTSRQLRFLDLEAKSPLYTHFIETLEGLSTIRAFGWSSNFHEKHLKYLDDSQRPYYLLFCVQRWLNLVMDLIVAILATVLMALAFSLRSTTSPGALGVALTSVLAFNQTLQGLITSWTSLETSLGAIARTKTFAEGSPMEREDIGMTEPSEEWPVRGEIGFSNVTASYNDNDPAIQNISMKIPAGSKIGICGRTGSGKSTLIYTLLGLLTPSSGRITIDSTLTTNIPLNILRARLLTIPQDALILPGSARKNLSPRDLATDEDMRLALEKVQLDTAIESRGGLDGNLSETPLSRGQQQLLALARAIIGKAGRESGILILDEASSNVDTKTDRLIRDVIRDEFGGWTVLTVAHRMESLADCDTIFVLHEGKIMSFGPPAEVFQNEGGI